MMGTGRKLWIVLLVAGFMVMLNYPLSWPYQVEQAAPHHPPEHSSDVIQSAITRVQTDPAMLDTMWKVGRTRSFDLALRIAQELYYMGCENLNLPHVPLENFIPESPSRSQRETTIYVITPTFRRPEQIAELTRLSQTLMHLPNLVWLVVEDADHISSPVARLLYDAGLPYVHLVAPMPAKFKDKKVKPRGVSNRNRALEWLRANASSDSVMYFADDDNTYHIDLFEEIRSTKTVSMFPVGLCTRFGVSSPVVVDGRITGFYDGWIGGRKFPVDMAGFAVNVGFLFTRPKAIMPYRPGFEEDGFLRSLAPLEPSDIELKANDCTKILVWHTQTRKNEPSAALNLTKYNNSNIVLLKQQLV